MVVIGTNEVGKIWSDPPEDETLDARQQLKRTSRGALEASFPDLDRRDNPAPTHDTSLE